LGLSLRFGSGNYTPTQEQPIRQTPVQVERQLKHPSLTEQMMEGSQSPSYSVQNLVKISGGAKQNKAGINDLPDSSRFIYRLETKSAKKTVKKVWKNSKAQKELLAGLKRMDKGELLPRNEKSLKGFKKLKEVKLNDVRVIVNPGRKGDPDEIVGIVMRKDLKAFTNGFDKKFQ
jgi:hypothetical protein